MPTPTSTAELADVWAAGLQVVPDGEVRRISRLRASSCTRHGRTSVCVRDRLVRYPREQLFVRLHDRAAESPRSAANARDDGSWVPAASRPDRMASAATALGRPAAEARLESRCSSCRHWSMILASTWIIRVDQIQASVVAVSSDEYVTHLPRINVAKEASASYRAMLL